MSNPDEQPQVSEEQRVMDTLLAKLRLEAASGKMPITKFDMFWAQSVEHLERNLRDTLGVTDEDQLKQLLTYAKGVSRMTWAAQLGTLSASFSQMADMEMAVTQVLSEIVQASKEGVQVSPQDEDVVEEPKPPSPHELIEGDENPPDIGEVK